MVGGDQSAKAKFPIFLRYLKKVNDARTVVGMLL